MHMWTDLLIVLYGFIKLSHVILMRSIVCLHVVLVMEIL